MKTVTLVKALTSLTTLMAVAAPVVVFGFLYILQVHPARMAAAETRHRLAAARDELNRQRVFVTPDPDVTKVSALAEFDARTTEADRVGDVANVLTAVLNSPAVGGVSNVSIDTGVPEDAATDSTVRLFSYTMKQTPITLSFDARYEQIGRFFWNLRALPTTFNLRAVELTPAAAPGTGRMRAKVSLLVFHRPETLAPRQAPRSQAVDVVTAPQWTHDPVANKSPVASGRPAAPRQPDPVVSSILFSSGRRVAIVDARIVRAGDRVRTGVVREIEADAVVIVDAEGRERRVVMQWPAVRLVRH
jgi:hypothetical protein